MNNYQKILIAITLIIMTIFLLLPPKKTETHYTPATYIDGMEITKSSSWQEKFTDYTVLITQRLLPTFFIGVATFFLAGVVKKKDKQKTKLNNRAK